MHDSVVYGGKVGYYFSSVKWLGVETEVFNTTPNDKQQTFTISGPPAFGPPFTIPNSPGASVNILTWATNVVVRYPGKQFQPYAGVGLGVFFARTKFSGPGGGTDSDNAVPGLNVLAGLRYFPMKHLAFFTEYKYTRATFEFPNPAIASKFDYSANHFLVGVSYHF